MAKWNRKWRTGANVFDSKFEKELNEGALSQCEFHPDDKISYSVPHKYQIDFKWESPNGKTILIESKGRFMDSTEAAKYVHIRDYLPENWELVFVFYNPSTPFPGAKQRKKCGTKRTHSEWAEKNGFSWFTKESVHNLFKGENQ